MVQKLAQFTDIRAALVVGGLSLQAQAATLREQPEIVVATPVRAAGQEAGRHEGLGRQCRAAPAGWAGGGAAGGLRRGRWLHGLLAGVHTGAVHAAQPISLLAQQPVIPGLPTPRPKHVAPPAPAACRRRAA